MSGTGLKVLLVISALWTLELWVLPTTNTADAHHPDHSEPLTSDTGDTLDPVDDSPDGAARIIGSPEPGPPPEHRGDRGGSLQLATLATLGAGVAFIAWRVTHAARKENGQRREHGGSHPGTR